MVDDVVRELSWKIEREIILTKKGTKIGGQVRRRRKIAHLSVQEGHQAYYKCPYGIELLSFWLERETFESGDQDRHSR